MGDSFSSPTMMAFFLAVVATNSSDALEPMNWFDMLSKQMDAWLETFPLETAVASVLVLSLAIVCLLPSSFLEVWMGYALGFWRGFPCIYCGKVLGCLGAFLVGRTLLRNSCKRCLSSYEIFHAIDLAVSRDPYAVCFLACVTPDSPSAPIGFCPPHISAPPPAAGEPHTFRSYSRTTASRYQCR